MRRSLLPPINMLSTEEFVDIVIAADEKGKQAKLKGRHRKRLGQPFNLRSGGSQ